MRHLLNTLFVTTQGAYVAKDGETVAVRVEGETRLRLPVHTLEGLVCFGNVGCSPFLLGFCGERGVGVSFLTENGRFMARVQGRVRGNVLLRRGQYRAADDDGKSLLAARAVVAAKVANGRNLLLRGAREGKAEGEPALVDAARRMGGVLDRLERAASVDEARGLEGEAGQAYFGAFDGLITAKEEEFRFRGRTRRPPRDAVNALLSFLYTLLMHDCESGCEMVGLDPAVGFLHRDRPGRPGLALDLMEEFRAPLADRLALALINRRQLRPAGFTVTEAGGVVMDDETRKTLLTAWQQRKQEEVKHPFLDETVAIGLLPYVQALLLARWLRGDLDAYPAFFWR